MTDINDIDQFFQNHPLKEAYFNFSGSDRSGAAAVAYRDVTAFLHYAEIPENYRETVTAAIAEQCVYLLLNPAALTGESDTLLRENSAGNQRAYRDRQHPLCIRAAALLEPLTADPVFAGGALPGTVNDNFKSAVTMPLSRG